jgi:ketosteroid isomerase-like protein
MSPEERKDTVRGVFEAFRTQDRSRIEALLADEFTFTSPYDDAIDRDEYFRRCWPNAGRIKEHVLEKVIDSGDEVFVRYLCRTADGKEFRNVETFGFAGGKVSAVNVYFGAGYVNGAFQKQD